jgi:hypothetical protein
LNNHNLVAIDILFLGPRVIRVEFVMGVSGPAAPGELT